MATATCCSCEACRGKVVLGPCPVSRDAATSPVAFRATHKKGGRPTWRRPPVLLWWRCGESNSGPRRTPDRCLQAQPRVGLGRATPCGPRRTPQLVLPWSRPYQRRAATHPPSLTPRRERGRLPGWRLLVVTRQREPEAHRNSCRQFDLTVPLFCVERRPRPAARLKPTLSKPVTPRDGCGANCHHASCQGTRAPCARRQVYPAAGGQDRTLGKAAADCRGASGARRADGGMRSAAENHGV